MNITYLIEKYIGNGMFINILRKTPKGIVTLKYTANDGDTDFIIDAANFRTKYGNFEVKKKQGKSVWIEAKASFHMTLINGLKLIGFNGMVEEN